MSARGVRIVSVVKTSDDLRDMEDSQCGMMLVD